MTADHRDGSQRRIIRLVGLLEWAGAEMMGYDVIGQLNWRRGWDGIFGVSSRVYRSKTSFYQSMKGGNECYCR